MQIDISEIVSCENREVTEKVHIEQDTFVSSLVSSRSQRARRLISGLRTARAVNCF